MYDVVLMSLNVMILMLAIVINEKLDELKYKEFDKDKNGDDLK